MELSTFHYDLPEQLMAQQPVHPRDCSRMMVVNKETGEMKNYHFFDLPLLLHDNDIIVVNDTRVLPAVLRGRRQNGSQLEIKMVSRKSPTCWDCLAEARRPLTSGEQLVFGDNADLIGTVTEANWCRTGWLIEFAAAEGTIEEQMKRLGRLFLPLHLPQMLDDPEDYQTVYSSQEGSLQPPTAGLHFTERMLKQLAEMRYPVVPITQHVGRIDRPLPTERVEEHRMYEESYQVSEEAAEAINAARRKGGRVVAIGTTVTRTLETVVTGDGLIRPGSGWTKLYIYPGFRFRAIDALLSNFQSPGITTLILACAFAGTDLVMSAYREAARRNYRFLEFGDCIFFT